MLNGSRPSVHNEQRPTQQNTRRLAASIRAHIRFLIGCCIKARLPTSATIVFFISAEFL